MEEQSARAKRNGLDVVFQADGFQIDANDPNKSIDELLKRYFNPEMIQYTIVLKMKSDPNRVSFYYPVETRNLRPAAKQKPDPNS